MHLTLDDLSGPDIGESRPIDERDLEVLRAAPKVQTPPRKKLRYKHHALARSLAAGMQESAAAAITGFAPVTVSILKRDPAFAELVRFYARRRERGLTRSGRRSLGVGQKLVEEIQRRVTTRRRRSRCGTCGRPARCCLDRAGWARRKVSTHDVHIHTGLADAIKASRVNAPFPALDRAKLD